MEERPPIRVLVVDDSFLMRTLLRRLLEEDSDIKVVGVAKDGLEAIGKSKELEPDVITMDFMMPEMDGIDATRHISENSPTPPKIVVVSAYSQNRDELIARWMNSKAVGFIAKPSDHVSVDLDVIKDDLIREVRAAAQSRSLTVGFQEGNKKKKMPISAKKIDKIFVIGASTGGPKLIHEIISTLPEYFNYTVLVVQHMPEGFTNGFAKRLNEYSYLPVTEVREGDLLEPGHIYVAPGAMNMGIEPWEDAGKTLLRFHLNREPNEHHVFPSIDHTMTTVAKIFGEMTHGLLLSGMGKDGVKGLAEIKKYGGVTLAQEPETCVVDSMPNTAIVEGYVDKIVTPEKIHRYLEKIAKK